ncbi:MAG: tape measure protein [Acidobacteria bacterium]|nr:tape measure protein [Acidobacteriota bacterium]
MGDEDLERIRTIFAADISRFERAMVTYANRTENAARKAERAFSDANKKIAASTDAMARDVRRAVVGIAVAVAGREILQYEEQWRNTVNTLKQYSAVLGDAKASAADLNVIAGEAAVPLASLGNLTGAAARSAKDLGKSRKDVLQFVESVSKGAQIANNGAAAVSGAITQLSQAIASPRVQLGEFNSIVEGTPRLAQAFAEGIDKAGGSVAKLRQLIAAGDISGNELFSGLLSQTGKLRTEFDGMTTGVTEAFIRLQNKLIEFVGSNEGVQNSVQALSRFIEGAADNLDTFANAAVVAAAVLGGALAGQALLATVSGFASITKGATAATAAMRLFGITAGVFGGPIPLLIGVIAGAYVLLAQQVVAADAAIERSQKSAEGAAGALDILQAYVSRADFKPMADGAKAAGEEVGILATAMRDLAEAMNDATIAKFVADMSTVNSEVAEQIEVVQQLEAELRAVEERRNRAAALTPSGGASSDGSLSRTARRLNDELDIARERLSKLNGQQIQLSFRLVGAGGGRDILEKVLAGDVRGAASLLRERLVAIGAEVADSEAEVTVDNTKVKAAEQVLDQLASAYTATFTTEREQLAALRDERLAAIELVAKSEADRAAQRKQALDLYAQAVEELEVEEFKAFTEGLNRESERERAKKEQLEGEKAYVRDVIDARDQMFGRIQQIAERDYQLERERINREIEDQTLKQEALAALEEEYGERRRLARDELLTLGDPENALETEIARIRRAEEAKLAALKDGLAAGLIVEEEFQAERKQLEDSTNAAILDARRSAASAQLNAYEGLFANVGELFKQLGGEQSKAARVALAISKAFAIADSAIKISQATAQVFGDPTKITLEQKIASAAVIAAQGASIIAAITGAGKGFAQGGYVTGPGGPRSDSIPIRASNGEFIVNADATRANRQLLEAINAGRAIPLARPQVSVAGARVTVNNNAPGTLAREVRNSAGEVEILIEAVAADIARGGGRIGMAMEGRYGVNPAYGAG